MKGLWYLVAIILLLVSNLKAMDGALTRTAFIARKIYEEYIPQLERGVPITAVITVINTRLLKDERPYFQKAVRERFVQKYAFALARKNSQVISFCNDGTVQEECYRFLDGTTKTLKFPTAVGRKRLLEQGTTPWSQLSFEQLLAHYAQAIFGER